MSENLNEVLETKPNTNPQSYDSNSELTRNSKAVSIIFLILSLVLGFWGMIYSFSDAKVVGGDAYNYIIGAGRGTALVGLAIIFAVTSLIFAVYDLTNSLIFYNKIKK